MPNRVYFRHIEAIVPTSPSQSKKTKMFAKTKEHALPIDTCYIEEQQVGLYPCLQDIIYCTVESASLAQGRFWTRGQALVLTNL